MNNREAFEAWAVSHGGLDLTMHEAMDNEKLPFMCTYYSYTTEIAWRAFANKKVPAQAALAQANEVKHECNEKSQAQQTESKWISVEERLPEEAIFVDVYIRSRRNPDFGQRKISVPFVNGSFEIDHLFDYEYVSHWMPYPLPPAPEGDKP